MCTGPEDSIRHGETMKDRLPLYVFLLFLLFLMAGIFLREPDDVFQKAVTICLSCIGIG